MVRTNNMTQHSLHRHPQHTAATHLQVLASKKQLQAVCKVDGWRLAAPAVGFDVRHQQLKRGHIALDCDLWWCGAAHWWV